MRKFLPLILLTILALAFLLGHAARGWIGIEFSPEGIRSWVAALGWRGPAIFVALVTFRLFLFTPSAFLLTAGGLCFGAIDGTLLGAAGILISSVLIFGLGRGMGRDWLRERFRERFARFERRASAAGPFLVGLVTAHPMGAMAPFHWGAGLSSVSLVAFLITVSIAGPIRAGIYSLLGSMLIEWDWTSPHALAATVGLLALALLPLAHPELRRRILAVGGRQPG